MTGARPKERTKLGRVSIENGEHLGGANFIEGVLGTHRWWFLEGAEAGDAYEASILMSHLGVISQVLVHRELLELELREPGFGEDAPALGCDGARYAPEKVGQRVR